MAERAPLPFTTPTIARLYMLQGKLDEAEAIYRGLQAERPDDPRPREGLAELERRRSASGVADEGTDSLVELLAPSAGAPLECRYRVSEAGRKRASLVLGSPGALALRLRAFPDGKQEDLALDATSGSVAVPASVPGAVVAAAVGLRDESGRFVSIAHALGPR